MPPVMKPVGPAFEMVTITIAPMLPSMGSSDVMRPPLSLGTSSGGACTTILPPGTRGGASRGPALMTHLREVC